MRVLHWLNAFPDTGGIQSFCAELVPELIDRGHEVLLLTGHTGAAQPDHSMHGQIEVRRVDCRRALVERDPRRILRAKIEIADNLFHENGALFGAEDPGRGAVVGFLSARAGQLGPGLALDVADLGVLMARALADHAGPAAADGSFVRVAGETRATGVRRASASVRAAASSTTAVSGDVDPQAIAAELGRRLAGWQAAEAAPWPPPGPRHELRPGLYRVEKEIPQGKVRMGHRSIQVADWPSPEIYALEVMNDILGGGGFSSRMMRRVRSDEGLAYGAGTTFGFGVFWPGTFTVGYASKNPTVA